jgi:hypothetical protein
LRLFLAVRHSLKKSNTNTIVVVTLFVSSRHTGIECRPILFEISPGQHTDERTRHDDTTSRRAHPERERTRSARRQFIRSADGDNRRSLANHCRCDSTSRSSSFPRASTSVRLTDRGQKCLQPTPMRKSLELSMDFSSESVDDTIELFPLTHLSRIRPRKSSRRRSRLTNGAALVANGRSRTVSTRAASILRRARRCVSHSASGHSREHSSNVDTIHCKFNNPHTSLKADTLRSVAHFDQLVEGEISFLLQTLVEQIVRFTVFDIDARSAESIEILG